MYIKSLVNTAMHAWEMFRFRLLRLEHNIQSRRREIQLRFAFIAGINQAKLDAVVAETLSLDGFTDKPAPRIVRTLKCFLEI